MLSGESVLQDNLRQMTLRFQPRALFLALALGACLPPDSAQTITHETPATPGQLSVWLHSGDPRLVAWAATLARERKESAVIAELPGWLKQSSLLHDYGYVPARPEDRAYQAVLDALIRGGSRPAVDAKTLLPVGRVYPVQAFVLLDRLPADEQLSVLKSWFRYASRMSEYGEIARFASMRLAQWPAPVPQFAALLLSETQEQLTVNIVRRPDSGFLAGLGGACGDSLGLPVSPGWPVVYFPVAEQEATAASVPLIALDGHSISYRWVSENVGWGSCSGSGVLDQQARWRVIAHWLKTGKEASASKDVELTWTGEAAFQRELGRVVAREEVGFGAIVQQLLRDGLLTKDEAAWARPQLHLQVVCRVTPCPVRGAATGNVPSPLLIF